MKTNYLVTSMEVINHRLKVESWPWWRQCWHRLFHPDCIYCQKHREILKSTAEQNRIEPPNSRP